MWERVPGGCSEGQERTSIGVAPHGGGLQAALLAPGPGSGGPPLDAVRLPAWTPPGSVLSPEAAPEEAGGQSSGLLGTWLGFFLPHHYGF